MEQSNSGMYGHGMPIENNRSQEKVKIKRQKDATMFAKSKVDELFNLVKTQEGIIITCGRFKVSTRKFKTYKQADEYLRQKPYEILINVAVLMVKLNNNEKENQTTEQKNSEK